MRTLKNQCRLVIKSSTSSLLIASLLQFTTSNKPENIELDKLNSGIFWATKLNVTRIGHGGSDPGIKTEMLSDLSKEIGVILFSNTSLSDTEMKNFYTIYTELYRYAQTIKGAKITSR